jgi:RNA polymerase primary sigma factor
MDRSAVAKAKVNRKHRTKVARRGTSEGRRASGRGDVARPANDTDFEATQVAEPEADEKQLADAEPDDVTAAGDLPPEGDLAAFESDLGEVDVTVVTEAADANDEEEAVEAEAESEGVRAADRPEVEETPEVETKEGDEPQSFLAMYFRDMAELDVLRPEQEFETARHIEELELDLWKTMLGFVAGSGWIADHVEKAMERPLLELKTYRVLAEKARRRIALQARSRLEKVIVEVSAKLKELDIDRLFVEAVMTEVQRVAKAVRGEPHLDSLPPFANTKAFEVFARAIEGKHFRVKQAKNEFVKANLRLVVSIARRFNHGRLPLPDLIQEGNIGLMKAVERYDYRRGFRFSTYASWWIRHAISRALADKGRAVRLPVHMIDAYHKIAKSERELQSRLERPATMDEIATATGIEAEKLEKMKTFLAETPVSLDKPISDEDGRRLIDVLVDPNEVPSPPDQMMSTETQREMLKLLGGLKPIEADILRKRFGLVNDRERTLKEIGDEYHLSRERVRQLQEQALGKMRRAMSKLEPA